MTAQNIATGEMLPRAVRISYRTVGHPPQLFCEAKDVNGDNHLSPCTLPEMAAWLDLFNFRWQTGSNGVWVR